MLPDKRETIKLPKGRIDIDEQANGTRKDIQVSIDYLVAWPSGLRRWFKAPVSSEAWVRIPPLPVTYFVDAVLSSVHSKVVSHGTNPSIDLGTHLNSLERCFLQKY